MTSDLKSTSSMTGVAFKSTLAEMGLTLSQVALVWGYTLHQVSRWANDHAPVPAWVPYALKGMGGAVTVLKINKVVVAPGVTIPPRAPVEPAKPVLVKDDKPALVIPTKPAESDDRPFRYMGGRKVYL